MLLLISVVVGSGLGFEDEGVFGYLIVVRVLVAVRSERFFREIGEGA